MRGLRLSLVLIVLVLAACTSPARPQDEKATGTEEPLAAPKIVAAAGNPNRSAVPDCFPFHDPRAAGPGPSTWGWVVKGPSPLFPGATIEIVSNRWSVSAHTVKLLLLPHVENAMWYGRRQNLAKCLEPYGQLLAETSVVGGRWTWTGRAPAVKPGENPTLVAVDDSGLYFLGSLGEVSDQGANQPFHLTAGPVNSEPIPTELPAVQEAVLGEPMRVTGADLPVPDGSVLISLGYHGWNGNYDIPLGTATTHGGQFEATIAVAPTFPDFGGTAVLVPADYLIIVTPKERPFTFFYTIPVRLLPDSRDQAVLAAFWHEIAAEPTFLKQLKGFPRTAGLAPCQSHTSAIGPDATCETQIGAFDPRHDPIPVGDRPQATLRTISLKTVWATGDVPRTHIWSFVVGPEGKVIARSETGDPLPPETDQPPAVPAAAESNLPPVPPIQQVIVFTPPPEFVPSHSPVPEYRLVWNHATHRWWGLRASIARTPENVTAVDTLVTHWPGEGGREHITVRGNGVTYPGLLVWGADGTGGGNTAFLWELTVAGRSYTVTVTCSGGEAYDEVREVCPDIVRSVRVVDLGAPLQ